MPKFILSLLLLCAWLSGVPARAEEKAVISAMESLAETGLEQALKAIAAEGTLYPFALASKGDGKLTLLAYKGEAVERPPAEQYAPYLYNLVRGVTEQNPGITTAAIFRLLDVGGEEKDIPGVWVLVDHRQAEQPRVMFQPLAKDKNGKMVLGDIVVEYSSESLFARASDTSKSGTPKENHKKDSKKASQ